MTIEISPLEIHDLNHTTTRITLLSISMSGLYSFHADFACMDIIGGSDPVAAALSRLSSAPLQIALIVRRARACATACSCWIQTRLGYISYGRSGVASPSYPQTPPSRLPSGSLKSAHQFLLLRSKSVLHLYETSGRALTLHTHRQVLASLSLSPTRP